MSHPNRVLYNVTCSVNPDIHQEWLEWMLKEHIPDVLRTGMFDEFKVCRIHEYEENGITYAVQYIAPSKEGLDRYMQEFAPALQQKHHVKYGNQVSAFRTTLEILHESNISFPDLSAN